MELTKQQGEWVGRATGALFALWLGYAALTCYGWGEAARNDPVAREIGRSAVRVRHRARAAGGPPFVLFYVAAAGLGVLGLGLAAISIAPGTTVSALERLRGNPGEPSTFDAD